MVVLNESQVIIFFEFLSVLAYFFHFLTLFDFLIGLTKPLKTLCFYCEIKLYLPPIIF